MLTGPAYHEDTDAGVVVYYANYLKYASARSAMLRLGGWENRRLTRGEYPGQDAGVMFVIRVFAVDYQPRGGNRRPADGAHQDDADQERGAGNGAR